MCRVDGYLSTDPAGLGKASSTGLEQCREENSQQCLRGRWEDQVKYPRAMLTGLLSASSSSHTGQLQFVSFTPKATWAGLEWTACLTYSPALFSYKVPVKMQSSWLFLDHPIMRRSRDGKQGSTDWSICEVISCPHISLWGHRHKFSLTDSKSNEHKLKELLKV